MRRVQGGVFKAACSRRRVQGGVFKAACSSAACSRQSTESPILFRSCEHETPFSDQNEASKIGDSVLWFKAACSRRRVQGGVFKAAFSRRRVKCGVLKSNASQ